VALVIAGLIIWGLARQRLGLLSFTFGAPDLDGLLLPAQPAILAATSGRIQHCKLPSHPPFVY
jgi:hypothetical protein